MNMSRSLSLASALTLIAAIVILIFSDSALAQNSKSLDEPRIYARAGECATDPPPFEHDSIYTIAAQLAAKQRCAASVPAKERAQCEALMIECSLGETAARALGLNVRHTTFSEFLESEQCAHDALSAILALEKYPRSQEFQKFDYVTAGLMIQFFSHHRDAIRLQNLSRCSAEIKEIMSELDRLSESMIELLSDYRKGFISESVVGVGLVMDLSHFFEIASAAEARWQENRSRDSAFLQKTAATYLQSALIQSGVDVTQTGAVDAQTLAALQSFVLALQQDNEFWGVGWAGAEDGYYTESFSNHINSRLDDRPNSQSVALAIDSLDFLLRQGVLPQPPQPAYQPQPYSSSQSVSSFNSSPRASSDGNIFAAVFVPVFQGFTWEWGDEFYCSNISDDGYDYCHDNAKDMIEAYEADFGGVAIVTNMLGVLLSPAGLVFIFLFASGAKSAGDAFKAGFLAEMAEGAVSALGIVSTHRELEGAGGFFVATAVAGVVTGIAAVSRVKGK